MPVILPLLRRALGRPHIPGDRTQFPGAQRVGIKAGIASGRAPVWIIERAQASIHAGALQLQVTIEPGEQAEVVFLLGQAESLEAVRAVVSRYQNGEQVENALAETHRWWDSTLGTLHVRTPLLAADLLLNRWLLYQALGCRFWGRSALYQSSGAFGFRDQLQDSMAFLRCCSEIGARPYSLLGGAPVLRRGCPALVASGNRFGRAHSLFR